MQCNGCTRRPHFNLDPMIIVVVWMCWIQAKDTENDWYWAKDQLNALEAAVAGVTQVEKDVSKHMDI